MKIEFTVNNVQELSFIDISEAQACIEEEIELVLQDDEYLKRNCSRSVFEEALKTYIKEEWCLNEHIKHRTYYCLSDNFWEYFDKSLMIIKKPNLRTITLTANYIAENVDYDISSGVDEFAKKWHNKLIESYSTLKEEIKTFQNEVYELILTTDRTELEVRIGVIGQDLFECEDYYIINNNSSEEDYVLEILEDKDYIIEFIKGEISDRDVRDYIIKNYTAKETSLVDLAEIQDEIYNIINKLEEKEGYDIDTSTIENFSKSWQKYFYIHNSDLESNKDDFNADVYENFITVTEAEQNRIQYESDKKEVTPKLENILEELSEEYIIKKDEEEIFEEIYELIENNEIEYEDIFEIEFLRKYIIKNYTTEKED